MLCSWRKVQQNLEVAMGQVSGPVQFNSVAQSCLTLCDPWNAVHQAPLSRTNSQSLLKLAQTHPPIGNAIQPSPPLSSPSPPALSLFQHQGLFHQVSSSHQVGKVLLLQLQHKPYQLIFRVDFLYDWLVYLLAIQVTLKNLQHHSTKASILQHSAFFIVHSHIHTWLLEKP